MIEHDFLDAMHTAGLGPVDHTPIPDGTIHRYRVEGDRPGTLNGWYVLYGDGVPAGEFGSWKTDVSQTWCAKPRGELSETERIENERRITAAKRERERLQAETREAATEQARQAWELAKPADPHHPYLARKRVNPYGIRQDRDLLFVPVWGETGQLISIQRIYTDGAKRFWPGCAIAGGCHFIGGEPSKRIVVCEGYATGASIHEATGYTVAVAFNAGNLAAVAKRVRAEYPELEILVAADDDRHTEGNPGISKARTAADAVKGRLVVPRFAAGDETSTDFNDLYVTEGPEAVRRQFETTAKPEKPKPARNGITDNPYFDVLGYANTETTPVFYIYAKQARGITALKPKQIDKSTVAAFCPSSYLQSLFPDAESFGARVDALREAVMGIAYARGVYSPANVRGVGAWRDGDRVVLNLGDRLMVDGREVALETIDSRYAYEARPRMLMDLDQPLTADEGREFLRLCESFSWERNVSPYLLAGWCYTAQICGALPWRPHIWISGPSGGGKSWIMTHVVKPAVGEFGLHTQFETTEAGLRQELLRDARPVLFDEAEGETERAAARIQGVMGLMRQASSESGARIVKGTAGGQSISFNIRAQFCFASILPAMVQSSDENRVSLLSLRRGGTVDFEAIKAQQRRVVKVDLAERLLARAVRGLPDFLASLEPFGRAVERSLGSRRLADQLGALLAGAWCLCSGRAATDEDANRIVESCDLEEERIVGEDTDEWKCWRRLMSWELRVDGDQATWTLTMGELLRIAAGIGVPHRDVTYSQADQATRRRGIRVNGDRIYICANHDAIKERLKGTPWVIGWHRVLYALPGADEWNKKVRFDPGSGSQRAIAVPKQLISD